MQHVVVSYSVETIKRRFTIVKEFNIQETVFQIIFDEKNSLVGVIEKDLSFINGDYRHKVVANFYCNTCHYELKSDLLIDNTGNIPPKD